MPTTITKVLSPLASLRLTVVLFALSVFLVFTGTVAQIDKGIWTVVSDYFRCYITWIDFKVFFPRSWNVPGGIYFPGGWLIGLALLCNILTAHLVRFTMRARGGRLLAGLIVLAVGGVLTWLLLIGVFTKDVAATEGAAFWRVLWRLIQGGGAAAILWIGCVLLFKKRAGIVLLHGGIILLLLAEIITGTSAEEGQMRINQGETVNYVTHSRSVELAIVDRSDPQVDHVIAVPKERIRRPGLIQDQKLPFDIQVLQYMSNSNLVDATRARPGMKNPVTAGSGLKFLAIEEPEVSGTDVNQRVDVPAAYIRLKNKKTGQSLGTYLVAVLLNSPGIKRQTVTVDNRTYDLSLRFKRSYKPYSISLIDFRHENYIGTDKPKDFSAHVRLVDKKRNVDRRVRIWMNNPLRYAGETFYQASFEPGKNMTVLQVVRNPGWMLPYLSCMIVGTGLLAHFGTHLLAFLKRRRGAA